MYVYILWCISRVVSAEGPLFDQALYSVSVSEDTLIGSAIAQVKASTSSNNPLIYTLSSAGDTEGLFKLDYQTGNFSYIFNSDYFID